MSDRINGEPFVLFAGFPDACYSWRGDGIWERQSYKYACDYLFQRNGVAIKACQSWQLKPVYRFKPFATNPEKPGDRL